MKALILIATTTALLTAWAPSAHANTPTNSGCTGSSISAAAHTMQPFGGFVSGLAQQHELAADVHNLQAGLIPDDVFPNACN